MAPAADRSTRWFVILLLLVAFWTFNGLGVPSVERTQEARVLEVARQMNAAYDAGGGWDAYLIPHLNGGLRLQKPPITYWLAAGSYRLFGEANEWTGRFPFALIYVALGATTFCAGRWLFGARTGLIAAAGVLGSLMAVRFALLAETDAISVLFTTWATIALWRGLGGFSSRASTAPRPSFAHAAIWFHLGCAAVGVAALAKGPSAIFPVFFLFVLAVLRRDGKSIGRFFACGAPLTVALVAAPWYTYVIHKVGYETFRFELDVAIEGRGHRGTFLAYFGYLVGDSVPFAIFTLLGIGVSAACLLRRRVRPCDPRLIGLAVWVWTILVPLCLIGQKQRHYLLPIVPPLMLLTGWCLDRGLRARETSSLAARIRIGLWLSAALAAVAAIAVGVISRQAHGAVSGVDGMLIGVLLVLAIAIAWPLLRRPKLALTRAALALVMVAPLVMLLADLFWEPTVRRSNSRATAFEIREQFGPRPIEFLPPDDLPLQFSFRTHVHVNNDRPPLIVQSTRAASPDPLPDGVVELARYPSGDDDIVRVGERRP